ncbi:unnamed protein product [Cylindrotheca closterium]|uniref:Uncharacterized protein n=1 Tax=Cylindrotheca closterium TaxID=2856 RepID=A0AAD2CDZ3_9STRA|nr:unnamed protein product [Cylindrotheca closterium]
MDHLHIPSLDSPARSLMAMPKQVSTGTETPSRSTSSTQDSSSCSLPCGALALALALQPRRNYTREIETRTLHLPPIDSSTSKKLALPPLNFEDDLQEDEGEETIPTFSLKRKRSGVEAQEDTIIAPSRSCKKLIFRPEVSPFDE